MPPHCFVLTETYLNGCVAFEIVFGVTFDQQYAYDWQQGQLPDFTTRQAKVVPFITS